MPTLPEAAVAYHRQNLAVFPAHLREKRPAVRTWKQYQGRLPTAVEVQAWFANRHEALCLLCGAVSGHLEMLDFDLGGELYERWTEKVTAAAPGLLDQLIVERSPCCGIDCFGGRHVIYRCTQPVCGNLKLAQRKETVPDGAEVIRHNKRFVPKKVGDRWEITLTLIETRGEGGIYLTHPTPGYQLLQGSYEALPAITPEERDLLLSAAWELNEIVPEEIIPRVRADSCGSLRPGDDFNQRGEVREILSRHGWTLVKSGDNEYWRRPGKDSGWSASLRTLEGLPIFYCFSANAAPFEPEKAYAPFSVYTLLEHGGNFEAAARALRAAGYGAVEAGDVDLSGILGHVLAPPPAEPQIPDPGPLPDELLHVPGFIQQVMDHTMATAPYPQPILAFAAALTMQAFLAGRKIRDAADNRTNLYVLALANSGAGKDHPRKVNQRISIEAGLQDSLGDSFASGEGIEDRMFVTPALLFQTDEIDGLMNAINQATDARKESIMNALLKFYTSSNAVYPMRVKAGKDAPGVIDQPSLCMLGTAVPKYYYEALSVRMLNNGFFARLLILEAGRRGRGQNPVAQPIPPAILEIARWWAVFQPGGAGNLRDWHPVPALVENTSAADTALEECRTFADDRYGEAEEKDDPAAMAIWARAYEKTRKLALIYAASENHREPRIDEPAVRWAWRFVEHQTRRMLFMANQHVAEGVFDARCKRMIEVLTAWRQRHGEGWMPHWELSRRLKWNDKDLEEVRSTLRGQRRLEFEVGSTSEGGPIAQRYRLSG